MVSGTITSTGSFSEVGSLIGGDNGNTTVTHCGSALTLNVSNSEYIGGLIGEENNNNLTVQRSFFTGTISTDTSAADKGGLIGVLAGATNTVSDSYTAGTLNLDSSGYTAGFIGLIYSGVTVTNSYAAGSIIGAGSGDRVGFIDGLFAGTVTNSFVAASITGSGSRLDAFFGASSGNSTPGNYFDTYLAGTGTSGCSSGCTAVNSGNSTPTYFKNNTTNAPLNSWDFINTWQTNSGNYPTLQGFFSPAPIIPTPTPTSASQSQVNASSNSPSAPTCGSAAPTNAPNLFQINASAGSMTIYFVPVSGQNSGYYISYGTKSDASGFGVSFNYSDRSGAIPYIINSLYPGTWYVKVRGQNGCMPGNWSKIMSVKVLLVNSNEHAVRLNNVLDTSTVAPSSAMVGKCINYIVHSGDSLWNIAKTKLGSGIQFGIIEKQNNLSSSLIHTGQILKVGC